MTNDGAGDGQLSKNQRRAAAREKAKALRESHQKRERRGRLILQGGLILASLAIVATVTLVIINSIKPPASGPLNMASDGVFIGENFEVEKTPALEAGEEPIASTPAPESEALDIQIWVDYQCPVCAIFDETNGEQIETLVEEGAATLEIHPVAILDRASLGSRYSSRSMNAAGCVANYAPNNFLAFNTALFENQPEEQTAGLDDAQLIELARDAGVGQPSSVADCIEEDRFESWTASVTERAVSNPDLLNDQGQFGTPTVLVNGVRYTGAPNDATAFAQFIAEADGAVFSEKSSSSPSPSPSPAP